MRISVAVLWQGFHGASGDSVKFGTRQKAAPKPPTRDPKLAVEKTGQAYRLRRQGLLIK